MDNKKSWSERLNARLKESPGEIFSRGKWRFWFPLVLVLSLVNACMTAAIFRDGENLDTFQIVALVVIAMGTLLCWIGVGALHYSDSEDSTLARGVSLLDSIALIFMIAHFCFLLWALGHLYTLRRADAHYEAASLAYNEKLKGVSADNVEIARASAQIAAETTKAERLRNDTAYQQRKAVEAGGKIHAPGFRSRPGTEIFPSLLTAPVELERPIAPVESSAAFLTRWDAWIRIANFGELILAAVTLIYIRNRSAAFNSKHAATGLLDAIAMQAISAPVATLSYRGTVPKAAVYVHSSQRTTPVATSGREKAAEALRDHLRVISSGLPNYSFKVDLRKSEKGGGVWVRLYESREGKEKLIAKTKQSDKILAAIIQPDFRERLIDELVRMGFPIKKGKGQGQ